MNASATTAPVLTAEDLSVGYGGGGKRTHVTVVDDVNLELYRGETLALVGESGCGKSSLAKALAGMIAPAGGSVTLHDDDEGRASEQRRREQRVKVQMVFQDATGAMSSRFRVVDVLTEPWRINRSLVPRAEWRSEAARLLSLVGLSESYLDRYPHQLSGGQRQRVVVARALAVEPTVLLLDEPVSALDVSVQAQVINLLRDVQHDLGLAYLFISHDLAVVRQVADRVAVMYLGRIVESGPADEVYSNPSHPYTVALLSAIPSVGEARERIVLTGELPNIQDPPTGCRFRTRCWRAEELCAREEPAPQERSEGHLTACHFAEDMRLELSRRP